MSQSSPDVLMNKPRLTQPLARYVHARRAGDLLYLAGQGARDATSGQEAGVTLDAAGQIIGHDITVQTAAVLANIERVLVAHGLDKSALVDVTVFLVDMAEFDLMNEVWNAFFKDVTPPTRTTVAVRALPGKNFVEMKAIATFKSED